MANSMKQELSDEITAPSGVKSRISKRPSDPLGSAAESASRSEQSSAMGSVPVPALAQKVSSPFAPRPVGTLVSASAVRSAVMPARVSVPVPPRPALKTQAKAAIKPPGMEQMHQPKAPESKALESRVTTPSQRGEPETHSQEVATKPPPAKREPLLATKEPPPSERTQIYRPNLTDPNLRRSNAPDSPFDANAADTYLPKQPRLPAEVPVSSAAGPKQFVTDAPDPEDCTISLSSDALDRMIQEEKTASHPQSCAADEVTRAAEIPVETLAALQRGALSKGVGHDDVTRVYESPQREQTSDVTSPGQRQARQQSNVQIVTEPRVIIKPEEPKRHVGRWVFLGLCVAALAAGWIYRAPVTKQAQRLQQSIVRGIGGPAKTSQAAPVANVAVSISVSPADAKLTLDGNLVTNPYTAQLRPDGKQHKLVAEATGFAALERTFGLERDLTVVLALAPMPQQPSAAPVEAESATTVSAATAPAAAAPAAVAARAVRPVKAVKPAPAPAPAAAPAPVRSANCDPPYTVDDAGIKSFKPECM